MPVRSAKALVEMISPRSGTQRADLRVATGKRLYAHCTAGHRFATVLPRVEGRKHLVQRELGFGLDDDSAGLYRVSSIAFWRGEIRL